MQYEDGDAAEEWSSHCHKSYMENYAFTNHTVAVILGCEEEMRQWGPPLGLPLDRTFDCKGKTSHAGLLHVARSYSFHRNNRASRLTDSVWGWEHNYLVPTNDHCLERSAQ